MAEISEHLSVKEKEEFYAAAKNIKRISSCPAMQRICIRSVSGAGDKG